MNIRYVLLILFFMGLTASNGLAEGRPWLDKADRNGDGAVSVEEAQEAEEMWMKANWKKEAPPADMNKDSKVDKFEKKVLKEKRQEVKEELKEIREEKREEFIENHPNANPPGPVGGPGAGPAFDNDNNPPGLVGGLGTNWENKPGPQGGLGASPDMGNAGPHFDKDSNPPGMAGGPGAGPDRSHRGGDGPKPGGSGGFAKKKR